MYDPKYITYTFGGSNSIIVFGASTNHSDMAKMMGLEKQSITGAGFVNFRNKVCYSHSESLGVKSTDADTLTLLIHLNLRDDD